MKAAHIYAVLGSESYLLVVGIVIILSMQGKQAGTIGWDMIELGPANEG